MAAEKQFENKIKKYLQDKGCWLVKFFANRMTSVGVPDILACVNGWFVAVEVKAENGKMSKLQFYQMTKILQAGGIYIRTDLKTSRLWSKRCLPETKSWLIRLKSRYF